MHPLEKVLICAACEIAVYGWVSSAESTRTGKISTKYQVKQMLKQNDVGKQHQTELLAAAKTKEIDLFSDDFKDGIASVIAWAKAVEVPQLDPFRGPYTATGPTSFEATIKRIAEANVVYAKELGHAVAMLNSYQRNIELTKKAKGSHHFGGAVKDRVDVEVTIVNIKEGRGFKTPDWWLITAKDVTGAALKWFSTIDPQWPGPASFCVGHKIKIRGTIKEHNEFNGFKSTKFNRVVVTSGVTL